MNWVYSNGPYCIYSNDDIIVEWKLCVRYSPLWMLFKSFSHKHKYFWYNFRCRHVPLPHSQLYGIRSCCGIYKHLGLNWLVIHYIDCES